MKRRGDLFDAVASEENIGIALRKAILRKRKRRGIVKALEDPDGCIRGIREMFVGGTYRTSRYNEKILYEPKRRVIYSLPFYPDRIAHHAIMNVLEPLWDRLLDDGCYSCRKGRGCHAGSTRCMDHVRAHRYVLQCDIARFYPSIDHAILKGVIRKKIKDRRLLALLDEIIDSANTIHGATIGKNAPIGNLTSQWFGNLYMNEMDLWLRQTMGVHALLRYCDDFLIFSDSKAYLDGIRKALPEFLRERLALALSKCELYPVSQGIDFLGYRHFPKHVLVRRRVAKKIKRFARQALGEGFRNSRRAQGAAASYHGIMLHANTKNLRDSVRFDEVLEKYGIRP